MGSAPNCVPLAATSSDRSNNLRVRQDVAATSTSSTLESLSLGPYNQRQVRTKPNSSNMQRGSCAPGLECQDAQLNVAGSQYSLKPHSGPGKETEWRGPRSRTRGALVPAPCRAWHPATQDSLVAWVSNARKLDANTGRHLPRCVHAISFVTYILTSIRVQQLENDRIVAVQRSSESEGSSSISIASSIDSMYSARPGVDFVSARGSLLVDQSSRSLLTCFRFSASKVHKSKQDDSK